MPHVSGLAIAPVKGLALSSRPAIELGPTGVAENRRFYLVGPDGRHRSGLAFGPLAAVTADYDSSAEWLTLRFPDGSVVEGDACALGERLEVPWTSGDRRTGRIVDGPFAAAISEYAPIPLRLVRADPGSHPQSYPVSMLSTASLDALERAADLPGPLDDRRFRMLVTVDGIGAFEEDGWIGREVSIGSAVVQVERPTPRCATTTRDPSTGQRDFDALRAVLELRGLSATKTIDFGVYGNVVSPGWIAVGDEVSPVAG